MGEFCRVVIVCRCTEKRVVSFSVQADGLHLVSVAGSEKFDHAGEQEDEFGCCWVKEGSGIGTRETWEMLGEQAVFFGGVTKSGEHPYYLANVERMVWSSPLSDADREAIIITIKRRRLAEML